MISMDQGTYTYQTLYLAPKYNGLKYIGPKYYAPRYNGPRDIDGPINGPRDTYQTQWETLSCTKM